MKLPLSTEASFEVKIANGEMLRTKGACIGVDLKIEGYQFQMDINVLSLGGCNVVLGTQWLYTSGLIQLDFQKLTRSFLMAISLPSSEGCNPLVLTYKIMLNSLSHW